MRALAIRLAATAAVLTMLTTAAFGQTFFRHNREFSVGPNPSAIAARDLNDDGLPEIITADRGELTDPAEERPANRELSLLVAQGDLDYTPQPALLADFAPWCIVVANMDALKAPDLVVGSFHATSGQQLKLFLNLTDETHFRFKEAAFSVPTQQLTYVRQRDLDGRPVFTAPGITSLAVRDFDGDGYRDVIATGWTSDVLLLFPGVPDRYLGDPTTFHAPGGPRDVQIADFDGDGKADLAVAMYSSSEITLWRGDGQRGFTEADRFRSRGALPHQLRVADMNGDGHLDLVVSHCYSDDSIVIYYGDGAMGFPTSQEIALGTDRSVMEHEIRDIVVEDFTGDGRPDIAAACYESSQIVVLLNTPGDVQPITFVQETYSFPADRARPRALCAADFDANGRADLAIACWKSNTVRLLLNR